AAPYRKGQVLHSVFAAAPGFKEGFFDTVFNQYVALEVGGCMELENISAVGGKVRREASLSAAVGAFYSF
ncbi:hypothetical protein, partial [Pseudomonas helleri]|uniref:hypothetical protein n=1 Tax=Pseudomonas helleri TaxID=1608996 RepID=UPI003F97B3BB